MMKKSMLQNKCKVTKAECLDAIEYLFTEGFVDEMGTDKKHYVRILLEKVAHDYKLVLAWDDSKEHPADKDDRLYHEEQDHKAMEKANE